MAFRLTGTDLERYTFASQLAVLRSAPTVMTRLMKSEGSYLLIGKVLVISRLLHKALAQATNKPPIVDQLWERLLSARRKLIKRIEKRMGAAEGENTTLVESMCAYALVTSSTPTDVLHHFHKIRLEKVVKSLQHGDDELAKHGTGALKLCIQTCQDTQAIFPRRLADSLVKLKTHPLVQDVDVRALYELNLDVHDRWIGDEARNYTPWPRHDELQRSDAERILHQWSRQAIAAFLKGTKGALENEMRLKEVASLRQDLIETWILSGARMAGVKSANVLDDLRDIMNTHLETIVRLRSQSLRNVVTELSSELSSSSLSQAPTLSLWGTYPKSADITNGAAAFKSTLVNIHQGRDNAVVRIVSAFDAWATSLLEVKSIVKSMKEARWDDTFADDASDSDSDLDDSKQTLLASDDPRLLEETTQEALSLALQQLGKTFAQVIAQMAPDSVKDSQADVAKTCFLLRVARDIAARVPTLKLQDKATALSSPFTPTLLQPLHTTLAAHVARSTTSAYAKMLERGLLHKSKSVILWEGTPALPAMPSPSAVRYLRSLCDAMAQCGNDVWAPGAVVQVKKAAGELLGKTYGEHFEAIKKLEVRSGKRAEGAEGKEVGEGEAETAELGGDGEDDEEGEKEKEKGGKETEDEKKEEDKQEEEASDTAALQILREQKTKQALFDRLYLQRFVSAEGATSDLAAFAKSTQVDGVDDAAKLRLDKAAGEYARRTALLFGLLAG